MADKVEIRVADDGTPIPALWEDNGDGTYSMVTTATLSGSVTASTEYTEDDAAPANPVGGTLILVRKDTLAALTTTDGDNVAARGTNKGELYVKQTDAVPVTDNGGSLTVDGSVTVTDGGGALTVDGTVAISGTVTVDGSGVTQPVSNTVLTNAHSADYDTGAGSDTTTAFGLAVPASGGAAAVPGDGTRGLKVQITDAGGTQITSFGGGTQYTEGDTDASITGTALMWEDASDTLRVVSDAKPLPVQQASPGTAATNLGKAVDNAAGAADVGVASLAVRDDALTTLTPADGDYTHIRVDSTGAQWVAISGSPTVAQATAASLNAQVVGNAAHDDADSGKPVKIGIKAIAHGTNPTAVAAGDRTDLYANRAGVPFMIGGHPNIVTQEFEFTAAQTDAALITVSSGTKIVVTKCSATTSHATSVDVGVRVGFAAATLSAVSGSGVTGIVLSHGGIAPGSGMVEGSGAGITGIGGDGEDLRITCDAPTSGKLRVLVTRYTVES